MYAPLLLSIIIPLLPMTIVLTLATSWSPLSPFSSIASLFSHSILLHWLAVVLLVGACAASVLNCLTPQHTHVTRRIDTLLVLLQYKSMGAVLVHALFACCLTPLLNPATGQLSLLSLFLALSTSLYFILSFFLKHQYVYEVPYIKLNCLKLFSLNYKTWTKNSIYETFKVLKVLVPVFLVFYSHITDFLSMIPGQSALPADESWSALLSLISPSVLYTSIITVFVTHFLLSFSVQAATAILNHDMKFVLVSPSLLDPRPLLSASLTSTNLITKYLAYHHLVRIVHHSAVDRAEIFTLTGGHPVLWHDIYKSWKNLLTTLTEKLNEQIEPQTSPLVPPNKEIKTGHVFGRQMTNNAGPNSSFISSTPARAVKIPTNQFCNTPTARTQLYSVSTPTVSPPPKVYDVNQLTAAVHVIGSTAATTVHQYLYNKFLSTSIGRHILVPLPELLFENKFCELALILRGTDAVSTLCCAAITEDRYGVVQLVLPEILTTTLQCLKAIDQVQPVGSKKPHHIAVRKSLHIMLYQLSAAYGDKLREVKLKEDSIQLLQQFQQSLVVLS